jgi:hypothetical protein
MSCGCRQRATGQSLAALATLVAICRVYARRGATNSKAVGP